MIVRYSSFFRFTCHLLKYFGYTLLGVAIAFILIGTFGIGHIGALILSLVGSWLIRSAIVLVCMLGVAILIESFKN